MKCILASLILHRIFLFNRKNPFLGELETKALVDCCAAQPSKSRDHAHRSTKPPKQAVRREGELVKPIRCSEGRSPAASKVCSSLGCFHHIPRSRAWKRTEPDGSWVVKGAGSDVIRLQVLLHCNTVYIQTNTYIFKQTRVTALI